MDAETKMIFDSLHRMAKHRMDTQNVSPVNAVEFVAEFLEIDPADPQNLLRSVLALLDARA